MVTAVYITFRIAFQQTAISTTIITMLTFGTVKTSILTVCLTLPNADKLATLCVWGALDLWQHNDVVSSSALVTFLPGFSVGNPPPPLAIVNNEQVKVHPALSHVSDSYQPGFHVQLKLSLMTNERPRVPCAAHPPSLIATTVTNGFAVDNSAVRRAEQNNSGHAMHVVNVYKWAFIPVSDAT
jgi:hypothetical protein